MNVNASFSSSVLNIIRMIRCLGSAEKMTSSQIVEIQQDRFSRQLRHVLRYSEFYRNFYRKAGIDIERPELIQLKDLPVIDKDLMMDHFDEFVCNKQLKKSKLEDFIKDPNSVDKKYKDEFKVIHTSGSSGRIGIFVYGANDWAIAEAAVYSRISKNKLHFIGKAKHAFIGVTDGHYAGISLAKSGPKWLFDFLPVDMNQPLHPSLVRLNDFQPECLSGYSSGVYLLALEQLKGNLKIHPTRILCSADPLTSEMRETIRNAFGIMPYNYYAASESLCMGIQCDRFNGIHLFDDLHIFEIIKENGEEAKPGEPGNLVMTNLYNKTQPLIRYRMNDNLIPSENSCECGWPFRSVESIAGREEEFLFFKDPVGNRQFIHPIVFVEFFAPGLEKFQIIQTEPNMLILNAIIKGNKEEAIQAIEKRMDTILHQKELYDFVHYKINVVNDIPNDPQTGKFRLIIPYLNS